MRVPDPVGVGVGVEVTAAEGVVVEVVLPDVP